MIPAQLKKKVLSLGKWEFWLERSFPPFIVSFFAHGSGKRYYKKIGVKNVVLISSLYQNNAYHKQETYYKFVNQIHNYIKKGGSIKEITRSCEKYWIKSQREIEKINKSKIDPIKKLELVYEIITQDIPYVLIINGADQLYEGILQNEVPKYFKGDIDQFIGDASYPMKKNAHHFFEQALRSTKSLVAVQKEFGWIKVRDGFSEPFTISELAKERTRLKKEKPVKFVIPKIPVRLRALFKIVQELVYMRTLRSDVFHNLVFMARPTFKEVAKKFKIPFKELRHYSVLDLISGTPKKYPENFSFAWWGNEHAFFYKPLFKDTIQSANIVQGKIANMGKVRGIAKIVKTAQQIDKVKKGEILFAPSTAPSYILGMKKAAAFVTDEGGITSHAAIIAREMNKPCIIGTKNATQIFKDGDMVEVDANKGMVKKLLKK